MVSTSDSVSLLRTRDGLQNCAQISMVGTGHPIHDFNAQKFRGMENFREWTSDKKTKILFFLFQGPLRPKHMWQACLLAMARRLTRSLVYGLATHHTGTKRTAWPRDGEGTSTMYITVSGPVAWNSLPVALRSSDVTEETFRRHLKTFLFNCLDNNYTLIIIIIILAFKAHFNSVGFYFGIIQMEPKKISHY